MRVALKAGAAPRDAEEAVDADGAPAPPAAAPRAPAAPQPNPEELVHSMLSGARPPVTQRALRGTGLPVDGALFQKTNWEAALRRLPPGTAGGPDGLRPELLLSLLAAERGAGRRLGAALGAYAQALAEGRVEEDGLATVLAARIVFIPKRDGGQRPLGVVGLLRRIIARVAAAEALPRLLPFLVARGQFGAGAPAGTEALAAFVQRVLDEGGAAVLVDRRNAYSNMDPGCVLAVIEALAPALLPLTRSLLAEAHVVGEGFAAFKWRGLFMGCALSPLLFALAEEALLEKCRRGLSSAGVRSAGFLDDKAIAGRDAKALLAAFRATEAASARGGQRTNVAKCVVVASEELVPAMRAALPPTMRVVTGTRLVGVPVGGAGYVRAHATAFVQRASAARRAVLNQLTSQQALYVTRVADGWPRVQHILRGTPVELSKDAARAHDEAVAADFAGLLGEPDPAVLQTWPLGVAAHFAMRLGGLQLPRAALRRGAARASALVQVNLLLATAFPPPRPSGLPTPLARLPLYLPRLTGQPARGPWGAPCAAVECGGAGKCHMAPATECTRGMCAVCCALACGGDGGCAARAAAAAVAEASLEAELPGSQYPLRRTMDVSAGACGAPADAAWSSFVLAARFHQPQRAISCALNGFVKTALCAKLRDEGRAHELRALEACSAPSSYAWLLAAPLGRFALTDAEFACTVRLRVCAPVLHPGSVVCKTAAGDKPRTCTLDGVAEGNAGWHALSCKCGGCAITSHNFVRSHCSDCARGWGVCVAEETHALMSGSSASKMDQLALTAGRARGVLAVDHTRRYGAPIATLAATELGKERKYGPRYQVPVTLRGFAYDEYGRCGPHAREVMELLVNAGARNGAGHWEDLSLELWARFGHALARATAVRMAHFAAINNDTSPHAPQQRDLARPKRGRATGAAFTFQPTARRPRGPHSIVQVPKPGRRAGGRNRRGPAVAAAPRPPASPCGVSSAAGSPPPGEALGSLPRAASPASHASSAILHGGTPRSVHMESVPSASPPRGSPPPSPRRAGQDRRAERASSPECSPPCSRGVGAQRGRCAIPVRSSTASGSVSRSVSPLHQPGVSPHAGVPPPPPVGDVSESMAHAARTPVFTD